MSLDEISVLCVYSALAVYALAFIAYAIDLSKRSVAGANAARSDAAASAAPVEGRVHASTAVGNAVHAVAPGDSATDAKITSVAESARMRTPTASAPDAAAGAGEWAPHAPPRGVAPDVLRRGLSTR